MIKEKLLHFTIIMMIFSVFIVPSNIYAKEIIEPEDLNRMSKTDIEKMSIAQIDDYFKNNYFGPHGEKYAPLSKLSPTEMSLLQKVASKWDLKTFAEAGASLNGKGCVSLPSKDFCAPKKLAGFLKTLTKEGHIQFGEGEDAWILKKGSMQITEMRNIYFDPKEGLVEFEMPLTIKEITAKSIYDLDPIKERKFSPLSIKTDKSFFIFLVGHAEYRSCLYVNCIFVSNPITKNCAGDNCISYAFSGDFMKSSSTTVNLNDIPTDRVTIKKTENAKLQILPKGVKVRWRSPPTYSHGYPSVDFTFVDQADIEFLKIKNKDVLFNGKQVGKIVKN